jgi:hypothetical protein
MSGLSIDRSSRGMDVEIKEMDVIVAEFVNEEYIEYCIYLHHAREK